MKRLTVVKHVVRSSHVTQQVTTRNEDAPFNQPRARPVFVAAISAARGGELPSAFYSRSVWTTHRPAHYEKRGVGRHLLCDAQRRPKLERAHHPI